MILYKIQNRYKLYLFFRAKKKIVLDLRRTKSTENLQAPDRSEATEDLGGSGMDLSGKLVCNRNENTYQKKCTLKKGSNGVAVEEKSFSTYIQCFARR